MFREYQKNTNNRNYLRNNEIQEPHSFGIISALRISGVVYPRRFIMPRKKLPRALKKCERDGCENTFIIKVGAKYVPKYCSSRCAAIATQQSRKRRVRRRKNDYVAPRPKRNKAVSLSQIQNYPVNFSDDGGKFVKMLNRILAGEVIYLGVTK